MSRRVYLLGLGLALVALALAFTDWALSLHTGVTEWNARRIRPGMTMDQVKGILGARVTSNDMADKIRKEVVPDAEDPRGIHRAEEGYCCYWHGPGVAVLIYFDGDWYYENGRVTRVYFQRRQQPNSLAARLRAWLGL
jgi:hypothetical protein